MTGHENPLSRMRSHHVLLGVIAIVIAVALAANYYLW
jgi:hypothetical protein